MVLTTLCFEVAISLLIGPAVFLLVRRDVAALTGQIS